MIIIYHNPRCRTSREGLAEVVASGKEFDVIDYLKEGLTAQEVEQIIEKLNISPIQLVRKNEALWKEKYRNRELSDAEIIEAMANHPKLMERPVVVCNEKAVIGRPASAISSFL